MLSNVPGTKIFSAEKYGQRELLECPLFEEIGHCREM